MSDWEQKYFDEEYIWNIFVLISPILFVAILAGGLLWVAVELFK